MKYDLVILKKDDVFTDSKIIAEGTGNKHHAIQQIINKYTEDFEDLGQLAFKMRPVKYSRGTNYEKIYLLNEQQATLLITYLRNNEVVRKFKKNLVKQFFQMKEHIKEMHTQDWTSSRKESKSNRLKETDVIKQLVEYAKEQGSIHADKLYITYTKLANTILDCKRDEANIRQLNTLTLVESIILQTIEIDMSMGMGYKDIYKDCKKRIDMFKDITYMNKRIK